jgi:hypothetical protein
MEMLPVDKPLASLVMRATWISTLMGINKRTEQTIICGVLGITHEEMQDLGLVTLSIVAKHGGLTFARDDGSSLTILGSHVESMQRVFDTHLMNESVARGRAHLAHLGKGDVYGDPLFHHKQFGWAAEQVFGQDLQASDDAKAAIRAFLLLCKRFEPHLDLSRSDLWPRDEDGSSGPLHSARRDAT